MSAKTGVKFQFYDKDLLSENAEKLLMIGIEQNQSFSDLRGFKRKYQAVINLLPAAQRGQINRKINQKSEALRKTKAHIEAREKSFKNNLKDIAALVDSRHHNG